MSEWSPWKSWWMDLVKFSLTFGAGAIVTVFFLNGIEAEQTAKRVRCQTIIESKISALNDFSKSSLIYNEAAYDAWTELYRWRGREMTQAMRRYTENSHEDLTVAVENIKNRFGYSDSVIDLMKNFDSTTYRLWRLYDGFVDSRLDELEFKETASQIPRNQLEEKRREFEEIRKNVSNIRSAIIGELETILYKSSYKDLCREIDVST